MARLKLP